MSIKSDLECSDSSTHKRIDGKTPETCNKIFQLFQILPIDFIGFYIILLPAVASPLNLSAPSVVDVSVESVYEMIFICSNDARNLSALFQVPGGFSYAGNAKIILDGRQSSCEPSQSGSPYNGTFPVRCDPVDTS